MLVLEAAGTIATAEETLVEIEAVIFRQKEDSTISLEVAATTAVSQTMADLEALASTVEREMTAIAT